MTQQTDFRVLCAELTDELSGYASANPHHDSDALVARARAALAQPEPEGRPAPVPADGEVAELVAWLRMYGATGRQVLDQTPWTASQLDRAADLLEQRHPAPVPVSERLPGPEDCDAEGRCWWGERGIGEMYDPEWTYITYKEAQEFCTFGPCSVWLPATALPLPQGEVK